MRLVTRLGVLLVLGLLLVACGGDDKGGGILSPGASPGSGSGSGTTVTPGGGGPTATPGVSATATPATSGLNSMSLVYVDSRAGTPQLFVSKADGSSPRKVIDLPQGSRAAEV